MQFEDRAEAGRFLAQALQSYRGRKDVIVLALPRGGVPVGYEVARSLGAPLDVFVVRKLGVPGYSELAMGAIASGGIRVLNEDVVAALGPRRRKRSSWWPRPSWRNCIRARSATATIGRRRICAGSALFS